MIMRLIIKHKTQIQEYLAFPEAIIKSIDIINFLKKNLISFFVINRKSEP